MGKLLSMISVDQSALCYLGADIIGIFDCDHFPHPHNPRWAAERFMTDPKVDIGQGRCVVYNTDCFWGKMIAIEFDKIYAIAHPGRSRLFGFGLFCGSNGYWKADLLKAHKMHGNMLTEDIELRTPRLWVRNEACASLFLSQTYADLYAHCYVGWGRMPYTI